MTQADREPDRDYVARRWAAHRTKSFRAVGFDTPDGGTGFLAVDRTDQPPSFFLIMLGGKKMLALKGDLASDAEAAGEPAALARRIAAGEVPSQPVPVSEAFRAAGLSGDRPELAARSVRRFADGLGAARLAARLPRAVLERSEAARFEEAGLGRIRAALDADALRVLGAVEDFRWSDYAFYAGDTEKARIRRQAAEQYPLLAGFMAGRFSIRSTIDAQKPLNEALSAAFGTGEDGRPRLTKGILSRLRGVSWPANGLGIEKLIPALAAVPPDWFPRTREDWDAFCDLTATVGRILVTGMKLSPETLYKGSGGKWADLRLRLAAAYSDTRPPEGVTEESEPRLRAAIPFSAFESMPREKVGAAAAEVAARLRPVPDGAAPETLAADEVLTGGVTQDDIADWLKRLYAPEGSRTALEAACISVEDISAIFARKVILPLAAGQTGLKEVFLSPVQHAKAKQEAAGIIFSGLSAVAAFELARHCETRMTEILAAGGDDAEADREARRIRDEDEQALYRNALGIPDRPIPEDGWPPLFPVVQAPNGVYAVPLTDLSLLQDEGRGWGGVSRVNPDGSVGLRICVGSLGYDDKCRRNGHHIISFRDLRDNGFERLGCLELFPVRNGGQDVRAAQFKGVRNSAPGDRAQRAKDWLIDAIRAGQIPLNLEGIREYRGALKKSGDDVANACGYNWRERDRIEKAMRPWGRYVGKRYRQMGIDQFAALPEITGVAEEIEPGLAPRSRAP